MDYSPIFISLRTTLIAAVFTFLLGIHLAWLVVGIQDRKIKAILDGILTAPLVLPPTVMGYFLLMLFGNNRPLGTLLYQLTGVKVAFSFYATVISAVVVSLPLMYRSVRSGFEQIDQSLIDAAKSFGVCSYKILWQILIPCTMPSVISGMVLAVTRGMGEYGATAMLAGNISGKTRTLPLAVYSEVAAGHMDSAFVYVAVILVIALSAVFLLNMTNGERRSLKL